MSYLMTVSFSAILGLVVALPIAPAPSMAHLATLPECLGCGASAVNDPVSGTTGGLRIVYNENPAKIRLTKHVFHTVPGSCAPAVDHEGRVFCGPADNCKFWATYTVMVDMATYPRAIRDDWGADCDWSEVGDPEAYETAGMHVLEVAIGQQFIGACSGFQYWQNIRFFADSFDPVTGERNCFLGRLICEIQFAGTCGLCAYKTNQ